MEQLQNVKKLLCVRLDNMGDLLMSSPAITVLKDRFDCAVSVLTSSMGKAIAPLIPSIDEVIVFDVPWVKTDRAQPGESLLHMANILRSKQFDAAVIFTVFSQSPLPAAMLLWMADIPVRAAYCRENPYQLLTHWLPEKEPLQLVHHQVRRDLALAYALGGNPGDDRLTLKLPHGHWMSVQEKLLQIGINLTEPWVMVHPGVSEEKRQYPVRLWQQVTTGLASMLNVQVIITGSASEAALAEQIAGGNHGVFSTAGRLSVEEFVMLIYYAPLVLSVNTSTIHIAAATQTPMIVLYAMTNPQHAPWKGRGFVLPFSLPTEAQSRNEILQFLHARESPTEYPAPSSILDKARLLLTGKNHPPISELAYAIAAAPVVAPATGI